MFTAIRSTTNTKNKFLGLLAVAAFGLASIGLNGCAGVVTSASPGGGGGNSTTPLTISNAAATGASLTGFQVDWTTSAPSTSQVNYGKTSSYGSSSGANSTMVSTHQVGIASLLPGTTYHFQISSTDANGNTASSADMTVSTLPDTIPPTVSISSPTGGATISGTAVIITAAASDNFAVASVQFKVDSASTGAPVTVAPYRYTLNTSTLSNGNHTLTAVAIDSAGNTTTSAGVSVKVSNTTPDTTPPTVSITAPANGGTGSGTVSVSATAADNVAVASVQFQLDNANVGAADTASPYTYSWDTTKSTNGTHTLRAIATDTSNNSTTSASVTVTVNNTPADTTPPTVSVTAPANGATVSSTVSVTATAADNVGVASVQFQLDSANVGALDTAAPYAYSWDTTKSANGSHTLKAIAKDAAGNTTTSSTVTVTVNNAPADTTPPTVSVTAPANGATISSTVSVTATAADNVGVASVQFQLDGANVGALDTSSPYTYSWDTTKTANGSHTLKAVAKDAAGNSTTSAGVTVTVSNAADTTPPSVPNGLTATAISSSQINLSWAGSTDNVGVTGYNVYRGGSKIGTSSTTSYSDSGLTASTSYTYTVAAYDAAGNASAQSTGASAATQAGGSGGGGSIPSSLGWYSIPKTAYQTVCPSASSNASIQGQTGCGAVVDAWAGGIADTSRNRLVFWGGGHHDYWGNELYALDLNALTISRLDAPSGVSGLDFTNGTYESYPDGTPSARHTYGGLTYIPGSDLMYVYGGGVSGYGTLSNSTWTLSFSGLSGGNTGTCCWTNKNPSGGTPDSQFGELAAFDSNTGTVFLWDPWQSQSGHLWQYTLSSNSYKLLATFGSGNAYMDGYQSGAVDTSRKLFFAIGNGKLLETSIASGSSYSVTDMAGSASGCSSAISAAYPGVAFDSISNTIVIWHGGNSAYVYNPSSNSCTTATYSGGPTTVGQNGTYGRFQFFPAIGVFAVCNEWAENCFTLRLDATSGGGTSGPAISNVGTTSVTSSAATVAWTTDVGSTSQVDYGTTTAYGTTTTLNSTLVTSHSVAVSGLAAGTTYHFRVHSTNSGGSQSTSGDYTFSTLSAVDTTPPTVSLTAPANGATVTGMVVVAASASDNIGVASVQFLLDGSNMGSAVTQSPYTLTWDSSTTSNGAHAIGAIARDAAGNTGTAIGATVTVSNSSTTPPGTTNGWANRIVGVNVPGGAASIVSSQSFDTFPTTNRQQYFQLYQPAQITTDCTNAADGCSLEFTMLAGDFQGQPGWFDYNFNSTLTALYGPGQEFYVQYRERLDPAMLQGSTFTNFEGWKLNILSEGDSPTTQAGNCSDTPADFVLLSDGTTFPWIYENCGNDGSNLNFMSSAYQPIQLYGQSLPGGGNYLDQPGTGCPHYAGRGTPSTDPSCWNFVANEWFTVQEHIKIGAWGTASSKVDVWVAHQGQPSRLIVNASDVAIADDGPSVTDKFGKIVLLPYATNATWNTTTHVWYDDLIVSNRRIPDPEVSVPNAPDNLAASAGTKQVTLNWRVNSSNGTAQDDTGFLIERCTGTAPNCLTAPQSGFAQIASAAVHATTYTDTTVTSGTTYTYRVRATNSSGNSAYALAVCFNNGTNCSTVTPN